MKDYIQLQPKIVFRYTVKLFLINFKDVLIGMNQDDYTFRNSTKYKDLTDTVLKMIK